jgi:hypothetical protein
VTRIQVFKGRDSLIWGMDMDVGSGGFVLDAIDYLKASTEADKPETHHNSEQRAGA